MYESFATVWERVADAVPDAPAVVQGGRRVSYREVEDRAARLAAALADLGVGRDTHVALFLHNCPEYMECLFALSKLRAVPANVNFRYLGTELAFLVDNADAEVLVYHRSLRDRVDGARDHMPGVRHVVEIDDDHGDSRYEQLLRDHEPAPRIDRSGDDTLLWYTGGTTGLPKGVLWHQGTLLGYGLIAAYALQDETPGQSLEQLIDDVVRWRARGTPLVSLLTTPLVHATAVHQANTAFAVGGTIVLLERGHIEGDAVCATIERERPSVLEIVGDVLMRRIARALDAADARGEPYDLSSLKRIHNSGAMVSAPMKDALLSRGTMHVYDSLGSSEAVGFGVALTTGPGQSETARFRLGPNARLLTADDRDVAPGSGEAGVLAVHTSCAVAYYKDPERSAITFREIDGTPLRHARRLRDRRPRRHPHPARAGLELHQLGRREGVARGGRGGPEGAPRRHRRGRDGRPRRRVGRDRRRGRRAPPATIRPTPTTLGELDRRAPRGLQAPAPLRVHRRGRAQHRRQARLRVGAPGSEPDLCRAGVTMQVLAYERGGPGRVLLHEEVRARHGQQLHPGARGLGLEHPRRQVGAVGAHDGDARGQRREVFERGRRTVGPGAALEEPRLDVGWARELDLTVGPVAEAPPHVTVERGRFQDVQRRTAAVRLAHASPGPATPPGDAGRPRPWGSPPCPAARPVGAMAIGSHSSRRRTRPGRSRSTRIPVPPPSDSPSTSTSSSPRASSTATTSPAAATNPQSSTVVGASLVP